MAVDGVSTWVLRMPENSFGALVPSAENRLKVSLQEEGDEVLLSSFELQTQEWEEPSGDLYLQWDGERAGFSFFDGAGSQLQFSQSADAAERVELVVAADDLDRKAVDITSMALSQQLLLAGSGEPLDGSFAYIFTRAGDGSATVELLNPDGSVHTPKWIGATRDGLELNDPLGSAISGGKLYTVDIDYLRIFDLSSGIIPQLHLFVVKQQ